jgi:hypothetical protein
MGPPGALARPDWRAGGEFTAGDLRLEQKYQLQRLRRHLRLVHGWGVVCGLNVVSASADDQDGWNLFICPGYGIGPCGDEIVVPKRYGFNLSDFLWTQPVGVAANRAWILIEASATASAYESAPEAECGCGCNDGREQPSRLSDGFKVVVSWSLPLMYRGGFDVCGGGTPPCPPCPEICALPLACVLLPASNQAITNSAIDNLGGN